MVSRAVTLFGVVLVFAVLAGFAAAEDKSHTGIVVSAADGKLVMSALGKEHSHDVGEACKITLDEKPAKLEDLKRGMQVKVTTDENEKVTAITATTPNKNG